MDNDTIIQEQHNGEPQEKGMMGTIIGAAFGPIGMIAGSMIEDKIRGTDEEEEKKKQEEEENKKKKGGGCSGGAGGAGSGDYSSSGTCECHKSPKPPKFKLEIEENDIPENWWDKLPDFDPRVYDAILMEQAAACVKYIFDGLPDIHDLNNTMEARKNRKICPRLKAEVPRTKVIKPKEIIYDTKIDDFIKKDQTY